VLGILFAHFFSPKLALLSSCLLGLIFLLKICQILSKKSPKGKLLFSFIAFVWMFLIGAHCYQTQHSSQYYPQTELASKAVVKITKSLNSSNYYQKYYAELWQVDLAQVNTKILLSIPRDSSAVAYSRDDVLLVYGYFKNFEKPRNPYVFDYGKYLKNKQVYHQFFVSDTKYVKHQGSEKTFLGAIAKFRNKILEKLKSSGFENDELAIINALLLGEKKLISKDLKDDYANAGAIHILAVSGLHIGILLLIFSFVLKPFERIKYGKFLVPSFLIVLLWLYAALAGLSPSVVRAVAMFTAITLGIYANRLTNTYNTLVISMFFLLLFNPSYLFEVGFQLSYLAVFFIIWLHPLLSNYWRPKSKFVKFFWDLFLVSICAQIGVGALSVFYFHQFPMLFFVSNLVVLPFLGLILGMGVLVIVLSLLGVLPDFLANMYQFLIRQLNHFIANISNQEEFVAQEISLDILSLLLIYGFILLFFKWLENKNYWRLLSAMSVLLLLLSTSLFRNIESVSKNELVVFHDSKKTMIGLKKGKSLSLFSKEALETLPKYINDYKVALGLESFVHQLEMNNLIVVNDLYVLVVDQGNVFESTLVCPDILLLVNSPKVNLERLVTIHQPSLVIADGTNFKSFTQSWSKTLKNSNIKYHNTSLQGAFKSDIDYLLTEIKVL
jgi:competence protein ComEC